MSLEEVNLKLDRNLFIMLFIIGALLNITAMSSNDWRMPVLHSYQYEDNTHFTYTDKDSVKNWILTDIIVIPNNYFIIAFSIGDFFILFSFVMLLINQFKLLGLYRNE